MKKIKLALATFFAGIALVLTAAPAAAELPNVNVVSAYVEHNLNSSVVEMGITTGLGENTFLDFTVDTDGTAAVGLGIVQQYTEQFGVVGSVEYKANGLFDLQQTKVEAIASYELFPGFGLNGGVAYKFIESDTLTVSDEFDYKAGAFVKADGIKLEYNYTHTQAIDADRLTLNGHATNEHEVIVKFDAKKFVPYVKAVHTRGAGDFRAEQQRTEFILGVAAGF
ncbi:MAG: hypothetical protein ACRC3J_05140 [Culicoidibacterales bacterium]